MKPIVQFIGKKPDLILADLKVALERTIPRNIKTMALEHFDNSFRNQGFTDTGFQPWKPRKGQNRVRFLGKTVNAPGDATRAILVGPRSGRLRRSIRGAVAGSTIVIATDVPYANIHNQGGVIQHPGGTGYVPYNGEIVWVSKRRMLETGKKYHRTKPHPIPIPKRQFMGRSAMLETEIKAMIQRELKKAFR